MSSDGSTLVVSNLHDGFDVYDLKEKTHVMTGKIAIRENVPLPVLFSEGTTSELIVGSSCGEIHIHDAPSMAEIQQLTDPDSQSFPRTMY